LTRNNYLSHLPSVSGSSGDFLVTFSRKSNEKYL
jgi:hypothetical protein